MAPQILLLLILLFSPIAVTNARGGKDEKSTHLHFYFHDIVSSAKPTSMPVARPSTAKPLPNFFGYVYVADDPLTEGPHISSKLIGKAQGMFTLAAQGSTGLMMNFNFLFLEGRYNGSTLTLVGRNPVFDKVRELPVVGGSGHFRGVTGYALLQTYSFNVTSGDAVVEYDVYVSQR